MHLHLVALAWIFVVLLMTLAEATAPHGTLLGAFFTFVLYGVLPLSIVLYILATPVRRRAQRRREASGADPDGRGHAPGDAIAPEREEV